MTSAGPFYCNFSCMILDCAQVLKQALSMVTQSTDTCFQVTIGSRVLFAPDVHIYAATHPTDVAQRRAGIETAYPVTIGDDGKGHYDQPTQADRLALKVWIGGGSRVIGPCTIGDGVTIAAGSVVRGVCEPYSVYAGESRS